MAEYKQGDRVVKMSGVCAGKYGTVNSVREDGTLNVTFDGERLSRFCDPERCGKVSANAAKPVGVYRGCKISVADHSPDDVTRPGKTYIVEDADGVSVGGFVTSDAAKRWCDQHPSRCVNARAANNVPAGYERIPGKSGGTLGKGTIVGYGNDAYRVLDGKDPDRIKIEKLNGGGVKYVSDLDLDYPLRKKASANAARNADYDIEKFEVGKVYRAPWDRDWLAKVLSRTDSSVKVAIKSARDKTWHGADEQVTLRINPRKSEEQGAEVAKGWDWEFWADVKA